MMRKPVALEAFTLCQFLSFCAICCTVDKSSKILGFRKIGIFNAASTCHLSAISYGDRSCHIGYFVAQALLLFLVF
jgi:hypothetical protein